MWIGGVIIVWSLDAALNRIRPDTAQFSIWRHADRETRESSAVRMAVVHCGEVPAHPAGLLQMHCAERSRYSPNLMLFPPLPWWSPVKLSIDLRASCFVCKSTRTQSVRTKNTRTQSGRKAFEQLTLVWPGWFAQQMRPTRCVWPLRPNLASRLHGPKEICWADRVCR